jgi:peptide chain release factor 2
VDKVLDGYLEPFLRGYLLAKRRGTAVAPDADDELDV